MTTTHDSHPTSAPAADPDAIEPRLTVTAPPVPPPLDATETWQVGRVTITKFVEMAVAIPGEMMLPEATTDVVRARRTELGPYATDEGLLTFGVHGFVLDDGEHRILVDGGIGNAKARREPWFDHLDTPVLATMAAAGYPPEAIDVVVATHLHVDHVGWFTTPTATPTATATTTATSTEGAAWSPTFPDARHLVVAHELDHWLGLPRDGLERAYLTDSVEPVLARGLVDQVAPDHVVSPAVRLLPTPGHSPGHVSVVIESEDERAVITGDLLHHPIQVLEPGWDGPFDEDVVASASTRRAFLALVADTGTLVLGTHVPTPTAGRIVTTGTGWRWDAAWGPGTQR